MLLRPPPSGRVAVRVAFLPHSCRFLPRSSPLSQDRGRHITQTIGFMCRRPALDAIPREGAWCMRAPVDSAGSCAARVTRRKVFLLNDTLIFFKNIFRTFSVVRRNTTKYNLEELSPTTYTTHHDSLSFSTKALPKFAVGTE